jgi:DNA-binding beta-propeller fold protein YncE
VAVALLLPGVALATRGHVFGGSFGKEGAGGGEFKEPSAVAVNEATGDVYVVDRGNLRVERFSFDAATKRYVYEGQFNGGGTYEDLEAAETVKKTTPAGEGGRLDEEPTGVFSKPEGIAVDNSCVEQRLSEPACKASDPSDGDVYVENIYPNVVDKFSPSGEYLGQITAKTAGLGSFTLEKGVAVDSTGRVWLLALVSGSEGRLYPFTNASENALGGSFIEKGPHTGFGGEQRGLAIGSNGDFYIRNEHSTFVSEGGDVFEVNSKGATVSEDVGGPGVSAVAFFGFAVEAGGDVYVDEGNAVVRAHAGEAAEAERFGAGYLAVHGCEGKTALELKKEYTLGGEEERCRGGIAVDSAAGHVYVSDPPAGTVQVFEEEAPTVPGVQSESLAEATDESATFAAEIDPHSLAGEAATEYSFEYGACGSVAVCATSPYTQTVGSGTLTASFEVEGVRAHVLGLSAETAYHFRVVAHNGLGEEVGAEEVFTTRGGGGFALPDGRQWEMVSPAALDGSVIEPLNSTFDNGSAIQASANGDAIAYVAGAPTEADPSGFSLFTQIFSTRGAGGGWSSRDLSVPHGESTEVSTHGQEYRFFSDDLSRGAVQPVGLFTPCRDAQGAAQPCISAEASEQTPFVDELAGGAFVPLVSGCPAVGACEASVAGHADVPSGTVFGEDSANGGGECPPLCGPHLLDASPDLSHIVFESQVPLVEGSGAGQGEREPGLYEWAGGRLANVAIGVLGSWRSYAPYSRGAVSADGSRVFFTEGHLFVRVNPMQPQSPVAGGVCTVAGDACTVQVDVPEAGCAGCGGGQAAPLFQLATPGGSTVFFTDPQKLTADGEAYPENPKGVGDLYECELQGDACTLRDLTPSGGVHDEVLGAGGEGCEGGSGGCYVYFTAKGALAAGAKDDTCGIEDPAIKLGTLGRQSCNLYVRHYNGREWEPIKLVAVLSGADDSDWETNQIPHLTSRVSPNGRWLAFMSRRSLTGYDNRDAVSGEPDQEVYLYDGETGRLSCASCDPTGARPLGVRFDVSPTNETEQNMPLAGDGTTWRGEMWVAASVPGWNEYGDGKSVYQSRYLSNSGRLFFDSHDGLVPKDVDGAGDVYEYEPEGIGDCGPGAGDGAVVFKAGGAFAGEDGSGAEGAGCVGLISSGNGSEEAAFLDASETGGDVFFLSISQLSPLDVEGGRTLYDAQECTASVPCAAPPPAVSPPCVTEASCKAAPSPQPEIFGSPASATFSGPGDLVSSPVVPVAAKKVKSAAQVRRERLTRALRVCARERSRRRRAACERQARGRYGALRARKGPGNGRRAG